MKQFNIPTSRIEAFSDGVIAIVITLMVFDLKVPIGGKGTILWSDFVSLFPKLVSYGLSFLLLSIMWVNHHQLFHQIKSSNRRLLWYNLNLLFWMSLVPLVTNFVGDFPFQELPLFLYGLVFTSASFSFLLLREFVNKRHLIKDEIDASRQHKIRVKNRIAVLLYASGSFFAFFSVYISIVLFLIVPVMYFVPEHIHSKPNSNGI